ncbi:MAG: protein translocase subunit SecD [Pseudomonadota bacterium]|jgi:preprotein translocase subunit SecD
MLEYARWKFVVAATVVALAVLYALPNLFPQDPAVQVSANRGNTIDQALRERVQAELEEREIAFKRIDLDEDAKRLLVRLADSEAQLPAREALANELGAGYNVALNLASTVPGWLTAVGGKAMALGLDLRGGVHFLMEVDQRAALEKQAERKTDDIRSMLRNNDIRYRSVTRGAQGIVVTLPTDADRNAAFTRISTDLPTVTLADGPAVEGGVTLVATISEAAVRQEMNAALQQNISTLRNRINALGVAEPNIQQQGASRIVVQLPGVQDTAAAKRILGATATLEYRAVDQRGSAADAVAGRVPPNSRLYYTRDGQPVLLSKQVIATGDQLVDASSGIDQQSGTPMVLVRLDNVGGQRMLDFTNDNVGNGMAVVFIERLPEVNMVDGKEVRTQRVKEEVISIANVREPFGKQFQTTGLDSADEAAELALLLRAGALAAPIDIVEERIIGPSLGRDNIESGRNAVAFAFLFTLAFFLFYYRMFGVVTCAALLLNLLLVVAIMSVLGATMTLPGLAGLALTIGMSVDANVLINERIREELRLGNSPLSAIQTGYDKASGTIADANITALLAGIALFAFGSGPVRGFAITLCVGILTSMYTAVSVSRGVATLIYGRRRKLAGIAI